ncbi:MAG: hypothetical protein CVU87_07990 [Firmicutes bacterium HGW-Firmicutes-12]|nr:MAG: hypothetical protein CVU87_07990 [Firmicutes bacterium HGW-Firmicutes-12]
MKRKLLVIMISLLALSLMLTACSSGDKTPTPEQPEEQKVVIKGGSDGAPTLPPNMAIKFMHEFVSDESEGRMEVEFYESRQLGSSSELIEQVMNGTIDFCLTGTPTMSQHTPLLEVLQLPFLLNNYEKEFASARTPEFKAITAAIEEKFNVKIIGLYENGIRHFANNKRPVNTLEDVKGLKLRVVPSNLILGSMELFGANPTPMAYGEVYTALQNKVIDGCEINWTSIYSEKFYEQLKYVSEIGLFPFPSMYLVNLDFWNTLSAEDQQIMLDAADKAMDENLRIMAEVEKNGRDTAVESGVEVNQVENLDPFFEKVESLYDEYTAKDPLMKNFVDMAKNL